MIRLIEIELYKLFSSKRTYLTILISVVLMLIINLGLYSDGEELLAFALESIADYFYVEGTIINGYLIAYLSLNTLWVHIPLLIIIVTTYIFSSEFEYGTIKVIMSQPISRFNFMFSKIVTMIVFNILFMALVALFALIPSIFIFGVGDVMVFISGIQFILEDTFLFRFFSAVGFATIAMIGFSSMAMYLALYYKNTLTAILVSFGILIVCTLFQTFVFGLFSSLQPFMFTYHMSNWQLFFVSEIPYDIIFQSLGFMILMSVVFIMASIYKFNRMNILE